MRNKLLKIFGVCLCVATAIVIEGLMFIGSLYLCASIPLIGVPVLILALSLIGFIDVAGAKFLLGDL